MRSDPESFADQLEGEVGLEIDVIDNVIEHLSWEFVNELGVFVRGG